MWPTIRAWRAPRTPRLAPERLAANVTAEGPLGGLSAAAWDRLAGPHFYSTSAWLDHCRAFPGASCGAVVASAGTGRLAAVPVAELAALPAPNYRWSEILASRGLPGPPPAGTLVGPRQGYQAHLLASDRGVDLMAALVDEVRRAHRSVSGEVERACVAMYLSTDDVRAARAAGVRPLPVLLEPDAWIAVPDGGWDGWLDSLVARHRRNVLADVREFERAGCRVVHVGIAECLDALPRIANAMAVKYGYAARTSDFEVEFRMYAESTGELARVALCLREDDPEPIGFCLYYHWGDTIFLRWASFDYERLAGGREYFNLSYYSQIRLAGEVGARWLHAGKKALEAKVFRGAELRPLWLLDLSPDSVLVGRSAEVRAHNRHVLEAVTADGRLNKAIADASEWEVT